MKKAFQFEVGWRTYRCHVERRPGADDNALWWWFAVTGDGHTYAPFQAVASDTQDSVRDRIIAFHTHRLERRAEPPAPRFQAGRPPKNPNQQQAQAQAQTQQAKPK